MLDDEFRLEVVSHGDFQDDSLEDAIYQIDTWTVRLNGGALNQYLLSRPVSRDDYPSEEAYRLNQNLRETRRQLWEAQFRKALDVEPGTCFNYSQIVSEVFGACAIREVCMD